MSPDPTTDQSGLRWIRVELEETLRLARLQLEAFVEDEGGSLDDCVRYLHQVHGALEMAQAYGGAMLADEMEKLVQALNCGEVDKAEAAAEVLMLGMVQLPAYLERVEQGEPDIPLILLPLMNDLRASRKAPLVTETSLFAPKLDSLIASEAVHPGSGNPALTELVRAQRPHYHRGLLNWFRGLDVEGGLDQLRDVIERFSSNARTSRMRRLLDASEALVVALRDGSIETSAAIKPLFGQLDRVFKRIIDEGEEAAARDFPLDLLKNQLYYVARSDSADPVVQAVRRSADLANSFPVLDRQGDAMAVLGGPGKAMFNAVGDALRGDLLAVKDELDLYIRGARDDFSQLDALIAPIRRIGDTLGMVGGGRLRSRLVPHGERLQKAVDTQQPVEDDHLMALAADLLYVESSLSDLGERELQEEVPAAADGSLGSQDISEGEYREHMQAAVSESIAELARTKDAVQQFLNDPDKLALLEPLAQRLHRVVGVLTVLQQPTASSLVGDLGDYVGQLAAAERALPDELDREALADLVGGIEYYLESLIDRKPNDHKALEFAQAASRRLGLESSSQASAQPATETESGTQPPPAAAASLVTGPDPAGEPAVDGIDSEILGIFIEEAGEELLAIEEHYPAWRGNPAQESSLARIRRSFHTLKGSGRLVGASEIGELAWSVENLLNRVIDGAVGVSDSLFDLLDRVIDTLPSLIRAREQGQSYHDQTLDSLMKQAFLLAEPQQQNVPGFDQPAMMTEAIEIAPTEEQSAPQPGPGAAEHAADGDATPQEVTAETDLLPKDDVADAGLAGGDEDLAAGEASPLQFEDIELISEEVVLEPIGETPGEEDLEADAESLFGEQSLNAESGDALALPGDATDDLAGEDELEPVESILLPLSDEAPPIQLEDALLGIFDSEARVHLASLESFVEQCRGRASGCLVNEQLGRALHTLHGSADTAGVEPMASLSGALEAWVNVLAAHRLRTDAASVDLFERAHFVLNALLQVINQPGASMPAWQALKKEVEQAAAAVEAQAAKGEAGVAAAIDSLDPELVGIFMEEANELSEGLEQAFADWQSRGGDRQPVAQLQRALHTLKGGARLAGLESIGNLSHGLESLFESLVEKRIEQDSQHQVLARYAIDLLQAQLEAVEQHRPLSDSSGVVQRLEAAARGEAWEPLEALEEGVHVEDSYLAESELSDAGSEMAGQQTFDESFAASSEFAESSSLLTDSELLEETTSLMLNESGDGGFGSVLQEDSRIIQFPRRGDEENAETQPMRRPPPVLREQGQAAGGRERVRVRASLLDQMVNNAGEVSIYRARLEQQNKTVGFNLEELAATIERLRSQLRDLELETEAQVLSRYEREHQGEVTPGFDPLEMDRYSSIQQLSRALSETVSDLSSIGDSLADMNRDSETLLLQQQRVNNDLQDGLLRTRMVPFASRTARLQRVVRQTSHSLGKQADLSVIGGDGEMDRAILERMMAPLEHLLRNAVAHGIEPPDERRAADKPEAGVVSLVMSREGGDVVLTVSDDGRGLDREAIRRKATERGLLLAGAEVDDDDLDNMILEAGLSTADAVSQVAGRGVGMDVALSEVKQLGGSLEIDSQPGRGSSFTIRLPFTLAITEALLVSVAEEIYAVPHGAMDGVARISRADLEACYDGEQDRFSYAGRDYQVRYLGSMLGQAQPTLAEGARWFPLLLVRSGEHRVAIHVDGLIGNRQIVVKSVGTQLSTVRWFSGGTILADGRIVLILDMNSLVRIDSAQSAQALSAVDEEEAETVSVMVVDDSITVRKVTSRLLERHNMQVLLARDGVDAVALLQEHRPDVMLLDIEMPRMDGFELARHMRSMADLRDIPIIMITSRTGDKHRKLATELGVKRYLGKPYQESDLLENIYSVLAEAEDG